MSSDIRKKVLEHYDYLVDTRKHFHMYPELSSQEYETAKYIKKELDELHIPYETTGVSCIVATIKGTKEGRTVALRGDIDALPIEENTGVEFSSRNKGVMHACGHDCHATYMLGTAKILNELKDEIPGTVKIIFQEGEETGAGAKKIMEAGLLAGVDNITGLHITQELDLGKFSLGYGVQSSYGAGARIQVVGKTGNVHHPDKAVNSLVVAAQIVSAISAAAAYEFASDQQAILVPTIVSSETGTDQIPELTQIAYNFRTLDLINVGILRRIIENIPQNITKAYGAEVKTELWGPGEAVDNEVESTDRAIRVIKESFGDDAVIMSRPSMGGEDFSRYQKSIPGVFIHVGGAVNGVYRDLHTDKTIVDEQVLSYGVEFLLKYVFAYLNEDNRLN
jgi:amidohydrolase